jgi:hypothetical protein
MTATSGVPLTKPVPGSARTESHFAMHRCDLMAIRLLSWQTSEQLTVTARQSRVTAVMARSPVPTQ